MRRSRDAWSCDGRQDGRPPQRLSPLLLAAPRDAGFFYEGIVSTYGLPPEAPDAEANAKWWWFAHNVASGAHVHVHCACLLAGLWAPQAARCAAEACAELWAAVGRALHSSVLSGADPPRLLPPERLQSTWPTFGEGTPGSTRLAPRAPQSTRTPGEQEGLTAAMRCDATRRRWPRCCPGAQRCAAHRRPLAALLLASHLLQVHALGGRARAVDCGEVMPRLASRAQARLRRRRWQSPR